LKLWDKGWLLGFDVYGITFEVVASGLRGTDDVEVK